MPHGRYRMSCLSSPRLFSTLAQSQAGTARSAGTPTAQCWDSQHCAVLFFFFAPRQCPPGPGTEGEGRGAGAGTMAAPEGRERARARGLAGFAAASGLLTGGVLLAGPGAGPGAPGLHPDPLTACTGCMAVARLAQAQPGGLEGGQAGALCASPPMESLRRTVGWDGLGFFEVDPVPRIRNRVDPTLAGLCQALLEGQRPGLEAVAGGRSDPGLFCLRAGACLGSPSPTARVVFSLQAMHRDPLLALRLAPFLLLAAFLPSVFVGFFRSRTPARKRRGDKDS